VITLMMYCSVSHNTAKVSKGLKRHLIVDILGLMKATVITAVNILEGAGSKPNSLKEDSIDEPLLRLTYGFPRPRRCH